MERRRHRQGHDSLGEDGPGPGRGGGPHPRAGAARYYTDTNGDTAAHRYPLPTNPDPNTGTPVRDKPNTWGRSRASPHGCPGGCWTSTYRYSCTNRYPCAHSNTSPHGGGPAHRNTRAHGHPCAHRYSCPYGHACADRYATTRCYVRPHAYPSTNSHAFADTHRTISHYKDRRFR